VKQNILHCASRNSRSIHPPVQQNLIRPRVVATKLSSPAPHAPADPRPLQCPVKVFYVQLIEQSRKIEVPALWIALSHLHSPAPHPTDTVARLVRARIFQVRLNHISRRFSPVDPRQQQCSSAFQYLQGCALQQIRKSHVHHLFAPANRQHQTGIGVEFHAKTRRPPVASEPRKHPLKQCASPGHLQNFITFHSMSCCDSSLVLAANRRRRHFLGSLLRLIHRGPCAFDRIIKITFVRFQVRSAGS
jgi:hypothetical protein